SDPMSRSARARNGEFRDRAGGANAAYPVASDLGKPQGSVGARRDTAGTAARGKREFGGSPARGQAADFVAADLGEPKISIRPSGNAERVRIRTRCRKFFNRIGQAPVSAANDLPPAQFRKNRMREPAIGAAKGAGARRRRLG